MQTEIVENQWDVRFCFDFERDQPTAVGTPLAATDADDQISPEAGGQWRRLLHSNWNAGGLCLVVSRRKDVANTWIHRGRKLGSAFQHGLEIGTKSAPDAPGHSKGQILLLPGCPSTQLDDQSVFGWVVADGQPANRRVGAIVLLVRVRRDQSTRSRTV